MNIKTFIMEIAECIKSLPFFSDVSVISAYPFVSRPSPLKSPVLAVGFGGAALAPRHIGDDRVSGELYADLDAYVPCSAGGDYMLDMMNSLLNGLGALKLKKITSQRVAADKQSGCYTVSCRLVFEMESAYGGDGGE